MASELSMGTGRRKTSVARVYLREGSGEIFVNGKTLDAYFPSLDLRKQVREPFDVTDLLDRYRVSIRVRGGGVSGQAGACRHGIARALASSDESNRGVLRANGMLTRDRRMVERKKYGRPKARRRFQFSKR